MHQLWRGGPLTKQRLSMHPTINPFPHTLISKELSPSLALPHIKPADCLFTTYSSLKHPNGDLATILKCKSDHIPLPAPCLE